MNYYIIILIQVTYHSVFLNKCKFKQEIKPRDYKKTNYRVIHMIHSICRGTYMQNIVYLYIY
jgi:hypothetical protein